MNQCPQCGHAVSMTAAQCPSCGAPLPDELDSERGTATAERPAVVLPPAEPAPQAPADDAVGAPAWIAWAVVAATLVLAFVVGAWLVLRAPGTSTATDPTPPREKVQASGVATPEPSASAASKSKPAAPEHTGEPAFISGLAGVSAPGSAAPNDDVDGTRVTFVADNLLDADPATAWRLGGDQTGAVLTFRFNSPVTLTGVGLVNGWAKTTVSTSGTTYDWYHANRRVLGVEWIIGDQTIPQALADTAEFQELELDEPIETSEVRLRLTEVSPPGSPNPRDYTAISDVGFGGFAD